LIADLIYKKINKLIKRAAALPSEIPASSRIEKRPEKIVDPKDCWVYIHECQPLQADCVVRFGVPICHFPHQIELKLIG
jgi:hypothetical protein